MIHNEGNVQDKRVYRADKTDWVGFLSTRGSDKHTMDALTEDDYWTEAAPVHATNYPVCHGPTGFYTVVDMS